MNTLIMIPAHNEEDSLFQTVEGLRRCCPNQDFLVVNDGSTDRTAQICRDHGYPLLDLPRQRGLAGAFRAGMTYAWQQGYDSMLQFDADGQHDPRYIVAMQKAMKEERLDVVIGARYPLAPRPRDARRLGEAILSWAIRRATGRTLFDPTSGMRLYNRRVMAAFLRHPGYRPEPDTLVRLMRAGARIGEVPVVMHDRQFGKSYLVLRRAAFYMLDMCVSILKQV